MRWATAVKEWNSVQFFKDDMYGIPRKGGEYYDDVKAIMEGSKFRKDVDTMMGKKTEAEEPKEKNLSISREKEMDSPVAQLSARKKIEATDFNDAVDKAIQFFTNPISEKMQLIYYDDYLLLAYPDGNNTGTIYKRKQNEDKDVGDARALSRKERDYLQSKGWIITSLKYASKAIYRKKE